MTGDELRAVPWSTVEWPAPGTTLAALEVLRVHNQLVMQYGKSSEFLKAYGALALSWTRSRCRALWGLADANELQRLDEHARLIRIAHLLRRVAARQFDPRVLGMLSTAAIVLPRALRARQLVGARPERKPPADLRRQLSTAKRDMMRLKSTIAALEDIQRAAYATLATVGSDNLDDK
jgi:hypothetical protein